MSFADGLSGCFFGMSVFTFFAKSYHKCERTISTGCFGLGLGRLKIIRLARNKGKMNQLALAKVGKRHPTCRGMQRVEARMFNLLKQAVFTGVGLAGLTKEKVESLAGEFARNANLGLKEAGEFKDELLLKAEESKKDLQKQIDQQIDSALIQAGIAKAGVKRAAETAGNELQRMIDARLDAALERLGVARSREVQELTARVEFLEKKLAGG